MVAAPPGIRQDGPDVLLAVRVRPRASRNDVALPESRPGRPGSGGITIRLTAPPVGGAANAACRALLADLLGIAQSRIAIVRGETARQKLLRIRNVDVAGVLARLLSARVEQEPAADPK